MALLRSVKRCTKVLMSISLPLFQSTPFSAADRSQST